MTQKLRITLAVCLLAVGIGFMALGAVRGEVTTVWRKAATVCLECIGLG